MASALLAASMVAMPRYAAPEVQSVPDSRILVEGTVPVEIEK